MRATRENRHSVVLCETAGTQSEAARRRESRCASVRRIGERDAPGWTGERRAHEPLRKRLARLCISHIHAHAKRGAVNHRCRGISRLVARIWIKYGKRDEVFARF